MSLREISIPTNAQKASYLQNVFQCGVFLCSWETLGMHIWSKDLVSPLFCKAVTYSVFIVLHWHFTWCLFVCGNFSSLCLYFLLPWNLHDLPASMDLSFVCILQLFSLLIPPTLSILYTSNCHCTSQFLPLPRCYFLIFYVVASLGSSTLQNQCAPICFPAVTCSPPAQVAGWAGDRPHHHTGTAPGLQGTAPLQIQLWLGPECCK